MIKDNLYIHTIITNKYVINIHSKNMQFFRIESTYTYLYIKTNSTVTKNKNKNIYKCPQHIYGQRDK